MKIGILLSMIVMVSAVACGEPAAVHLPSRSECIVKINLHWPSGADSAERERIIEEISSAVMFSAARGGPEVRTNQAFPRAERSVMYLQFEAACRERIENTENLLAYVKSVVPKTPEVSISNELVEPGSDTIDVWGPAWADKPMTDDPLPGSQAT